MVHPTPRPVYLNLFQIRLPVGGVVSILHRVSGTLLVLALPFALWMFARSLESAQRFAAVQELVRAVPARWVLCIVLLGLGHHLLAGIRHLLLDLHVGMSRGGARLGGWLVLMLDGVVAVALGVSWL